MLQHIRLDLSQLTVRPDPSRGKIVYAGRRTPESTTRRSAVQAALELAHPLDASLGPVLDVLGISVRPPAVAVIPSPTVPMASHTRTAYTAALSLTGTAAWVAGINLAAGIYGSSTGEFGWFDTAGFVLGFVSSASGGIEYTIIFGSPADFAGLFVSFQASISPGTLVFAAGASLLFSVSGPVGGHGSTLRFMGLSINLTAGTPSLPVSFTVEWSNTWTHPLLK